MDNTKTISSTFWGGVGVWIDISKVFSLQRDQLEYSGILQKWRACD